MFFLICLLWSLKSIGQNNKSKFYLGGNTEDLPNVQLYLSSNQTYSLKVFTESCWSWQFYKGNYYYENDSLVLVHHQLYHEELCQIIDTFHRQRILNLLYINETGIITDTLILDLNHDTFNVHWFPLSYLDTATVDLNKNPITHTFYAPDFKDDELSILFYKPKRKIKKTYYIKFKSDRNYLFIDNRFEHLIKPFDKLKLE